MTQELPAYVSLTFAVTTFLTVGIFLYAVRQKLLQTTPGKIIVGLTAFWILFQAVMAMGGFFAVTGSFPPRIALLGVLPTLVLIALYFIFFRESFIEKLPLKALTILHIIRIPVELVLYWLYKGGLVTQAMTFEGHNYDILAGLSAPIIYWLAFRGGGVNRGLLLWWNAAVLASLLAIVVSAIASLPPTAEYAADGQHNIAVLFFPYNWLPSIVVPIVFFCHLASLWKLSRNKLN